MWKGSADWGRLTPAAHLVPRLCSWAIINGPEHILEVIRTKFLASRELSSHTSKILELHTNCRTDYVGLQFLQFQVLEQVERIHNLYVAALRAATYTSLGFSL